MQIGAMGVTIRYHFILRCPCRWQTFINRTTETSFLLLYDTWILNLGSSVLAGEFRRSHRCVWRRGGRPAAVLQLWVWPAYENIYSFPNRFVPERLSLFWIPTTIRILCFLLQISVTIRKFAPLAAPHRWSIPTPLTSTSAGTRCPMLRVGSCSCHWPGRHLPLPW